VWRQTKFRVVAIASRRPTSNFAPGRAQWNSRGVHSDLTRSATNCLAHNSTWVLDHFRFVRRVDGLQTARQDGTITDSGYMYGCYWVSEQSAAFETLVVLCHFAQDIP